MSKPFYKKVGFWIVIVLGVIIGVISKERPPEEPMLVKAREEQIEPAKKVEETEPAKEDLGSESVNDELLQENYKEAALGEAQAYIQLTVRGTITPEEHRSRTIDLSWEASKITGLERELFSQLAQAVKLNDINEAKRLYIALGGKDFEEIHKDPKGWVPSNIGLDVDEFRNNFNIAAKELNIDMSLEKIEVMNGDQQDIFEYQLRESLYLQGMVNKYDGSIRAVYMLGYGTGEDIQSIMKILIVSANPDFTDQDIEFVIQDVGLKYDDVDMTRINQSTKRNGVEYSLVNSKELDIFFIVSDPNDQLLWDSLTEIYEFVNPIRRRENSRS